MKKLSILIALAFVVALVVPAMAADIKGFGSVEVKGLSNDNIADQRDTVKAANDDKEAEWQTRLTLGIDVDIEENISARVVVTDATAGNTEFGQDGLIGESVDVHTTEINVTQSYIKVVGIQDVADLTVGRQNIGEPHDLVIYYGPRDNATLLVQSLDAVKVDVNIVDMVDLTVLSGKAVEAAAATSAGDTNVFGLVASTEELIPEGVLKGYYYRWVDTNLVGSDDDDSRGVYGVAVKGGIPMVEGLAYKAELAFNTGDNAGVDYDGDAIILGVSYALPMDFGDFGFSLDYAAGSGNDGTTPENEAWASINSDIVYGAVLNNATLAANGGSGGYGRTIADMKVIALGVKFTPEAVEKLTVGLNYLLSIKHDEDRAGFGATAPAAENDIGSEIDLTATYAYSDALSLKALYGVFSPGDLYTAPNDDKATAMRLEVALSF